MDALNLTLTAILFEGQFNYFGKILQYKVTGYGALILFSGVILYTLYIKRLFIRDTPPPISSWLLWLVLDVVAVVSEFSRGVFNIQLVMYTAGTIIICACLLRRPVITWDKTWDTVATVMVLGAIILLLSTDEPLFGLVISLSGMSVAAIPLIVAVWKGMEEPVDAWIIAAVGSALSFLDGNLLSGAWIGILQAMIAGLIHFRVKRKSF